MSPPCCLVLCYLRHSHTPDANDNVDIIQVEKDSTIEDVCALVASYISVSPSRVRAIPPLKRKHSNKGRKAMLTMHHGNRREENPKDLLTNYHMSSQGELLPTDSAYNSVMRSLTLQHSSKLTVYVSGGEGHEMNVQKETSDKDKEEEEEGGKEKEGVPDHGKRHDYAHQVLELVPILPSWRMVAAKATSEPVRVSLTAVCFSEISRINDIDTTWI